MQKALVLFVLVGVVSCGGASDSPGGAVGGGPGDGSQSPAGLSPEPTNSPSPTPDATPVVTPTNTPVATPTNTPSQTPTSTPSATPTVMPTATPGVPSTPTSTSEPAPPSTEAPSSTLTPAPNPTPTPTPTPEPSMPYLGVAASIPGVIEAEHFDSGDDLIAYYDVDSDNHGGALRNTAVDIESTSDVSGDYNVGWTDAGEFLVYTVAVQKSGRYDFIFRVASLDQGGVLRIDVDDATIIPPVSFDATGGWQQWQSIRVADVALGAGQQKITLHIEQGGFNLNYFEVQETPTDDNIDVPEGWDLVWHDEFSASQIDETKWSFEVNGQGGGNNELQYYTDRSDNASIDSGSLVIQALRENYTGPDGTRQYTSARLRTLNKGDFLYGRVDVRAKLPEGRGLWPAVWMLPTDWVYGGWAASGEIDLMEAVNLNAGGGNNIHGTLHYGGPWPENTHSGQSFTPATSVVDNYHVYSVEWEEGEIRWYVDGQHYQTQTDWWSSAGDYPAPFNQRFHIILNVAVGGNWPGSPDETTQFPQTMSVDYVRVFTPEVSSTPEPTPTVTPTPTPAPTPTPEPISVVVDGGVMVGGLASAFPNHRLYTFDNDTGSASACYDSCALNWPPYLISYSAILSDERLGFITRTDGARQLTLNQQPLYFYAGDLSPGDTNGDGLGGVWWLAEADDSGSALKVLFDTSTELQADHVFETESALITRLADRARDRHAREDQFQSYDHYLPHYWEHRSATIEIVDTVGKGGNNVTFNVVTQWDLKDRQEELRAFYLGESGVAQYMDNQIMQSIDDTHYTRVANYNVKENRPLQVGDRMEFELSQFLDSPPHGRDNYYGSAILYIVGEGVVPWQTRGVWEDVNSEREDSYPLPSVARLGGLGTNPYQYSNEPDNYFLQMATNIADINGQPFLLGRRIHHTNFLDGSHHESSENPTFSEHVNTLGPRYINTTCTACHTRNGRASLPAVGGALEKQVVKVGDANGHAHSQLGHVIQPNSTSSQGEGAVRLKHWQSMGSLRTPVYAFEGVQPEQYSVRTAPQLVGMGLLEAISEHDVLALADPNDDNNDGISGRVSIATDAVSGDRRLGRFGWKASKSTVKQQVAAAFNTDMGVTSSLYPNHDCGSQQTCLSEAVEISDQDLDLLTTYLKLLAVPARRNLDSAEAIAGEQLFTNIGCGDCHTPTFTTSAYHPNSELREQTIHPYTDLLVHDMGPGLADNLAEGNVSGAEWRTPPLWGIGLSACVTGGVINPTGQQGEEICDPDHSYLHDGRAESLEEAILWHGGEGEQSRIAYENLAADQQASLLRFLESL